MLITLRFSKKDNGTFVAHTDILRALNRTFRRAGIPINYSQGFNKHMLLKMTQPLPLGITSYAEYVTADTPSTLDKEEFLRVFNLHSPPYLKADAAFVTESFPALASKINAGKFFFKTKDAIAKKEEIEGCLQGYSFVYKHADIEKKIDASSLLYDIKVTEEGIEAWMATGNVNLRADALSRAWNTDFGLQIALSDIARVEQYIRTDDRSMAVSDYLRGLS